LLIYLIVCIVVGILIGIFSKRTVDEYKMYIQKNLYDIKEIYRDEYSGYSKEEPIDEELLNTEEIGNTTTPIEEIGTTPSGESVITPEGIGNTTSPIEEIGTTLSGESVITPEGIGTTTEEIGTNNE